MRYRCNRLHLDCVHLLQRVVEDTWGIDRLKPQHFVVEVSNEEGFGSECIWLYIDIRSRDVFEKARFAHVRVAADQERPSVGIDSWQTTQMLAYLFKIQQRILQSLANRGHATKRCSFELLALKK